MIGMCAECKFWQRLGYQNNDFDEVVGRCRRHAPVAVPTATSNQPVTTNWPTTASYEGCGEFEDKADGT